MILLVPIEKNAEFSQRLFKIISDNLIELADENLKWPHQMIFSGPIGKEIFDFIESKNWNFSGFSLQKVGGLVNSITFKYSQPLIQKKDRLDVNLEGGTLHNKQVNGIPGEKTVSTILSSVVGQSFSIEKTVRPEKRITLKREKK
jgi:hypothetical protein